jgi:hypothetical protein
MTITLTREEAQQVLDALTRIRWAAGERDKKNRVRDFDEAMDVSGEAIETLRARLSAPEPSVEPVAWEYCGALFYNKEEVFAWHERGDISDTPPKPLYSAPPQQEKQEPVAWQGVHDQTDLYYRKPLQADVRPLYTAPPQREWQGLTDEEIRQLEIMEDEEEERKGWCDPKLLIAWTEAKLKEKNT